MSAALRKGKWTGGTPVLGYDVDPAGGRLIVNQSEAVQVRQIFQLFADTSAVMATLNELNRLGLRMKSWETRNNGHRAGKPFTRYTLEHLLTNVTYLGL